MWGCESMRLCTYSRGSRNGVLHPTSQPAGQQPFVFYVHTSRPVGAAGPGVPWLTQILPDQLTGWGPLIPRLPIYPDSSQPGGFDYTFTSAPLPDFLTFLRLCTR